jgi:phospholipid N-methyltransferase
MKHQKSIEQIKNFNNNVNSTINNKTNIKAYWNFFPTPRNLIEKMLEEYKNKPLPKNILEPSAGKGDIIDYVNKIQNKRKEQSNIYAFEFVEDLQNILKQKANCQLLGNDFTVYHSKKVKFDLILMNPPFDRGVNHVLHAWDILSNGGKVIALLNQHTYYNAYNSHRLKLKTLIDQYGTVENLGTCFDEKAERKARVGVVLITLNKKENVYYRDLGINLNQYSNAMIRSTKAKYIVQEMTINN